MNILAIETSCDETAMALVSAQCKVQSEKEEIIPDFEILAEVVSSQIDIHRPYGGVVPSLAKREHLKNLPVVYEQILQKWERENRGLDIDRIAVTVGPGLEPALWTGINYAKELSVKLGVPLAGVNHLEGHIYSNWLQPAGKMSMTNDQCPTFPAIVLIVSGGHTVLLCMESIKKWEKLGETQDDAVGEAFDKVAKMLGLPYPGGPEVERCAAQISEIRNQKFDIRNPIFPRPMLHSGNYNFSFSGLKTAVLYYVRNMNSATAYVVNRETSGMHIQNICASFQQAAIDVLVTKTIRAAEKYGAQSILLCGGVAANNALQAEFRFRIHDSGMSFFVPELKYNTDNAVMIAAAAYLGNHYPTEIAQGNLGL